MDLEIFKKIGRKIKELWEKANVFQKFGLAALVLVLVVIKILKWAIILKVCCFWAADLLKWIRSVL